MNAALVEMDGDFAVLYSPGLGRPSFTPERLLLRAICRRPSSIFCSAGSWGLVLTIRPGIIRASPRTRTGCWNVKSRQSICGAAKREAAFVVGSLLDGMLIEA